MGTAGTDPHPSAPRRRPRLARCTAARVGRSRLLEHPELQRLLPLLMKQRNGDRWETEERRALHRELQRLGRLPAYLRALLIAGSALSLPLIARWLDRRRSRHRQT